VTREAPGSGAWIWGRHAVLALLRNPLRKVTRWVATGEIAAELAGDPSLADAPEPHILTKSDIDRLLPAAAVHQGVAVLARPLKPVDIVDLAACTDADALVVALDQVSDPQNVGAVMRSAAVFGAAAVIVPERNAPDVTGVLAKAASGAVEHVPLVRVGNLVRALDRLKQAGWWVVGLDGEAEQTLAAQRLTGRLVLVLGSEGEGMRRLTRESCDLVARLPSAGPIASLNVSNAAAVALYELRRQTGS
jgi:23S rRNA (guanosine2251-2'-O)-methyltransferase